MKICFRSFATQNRQFLKGKSDDTKYTFSEIAKSVAKERKKKNGGNYKSKFRPRFITSF